MCNAIACSARILYCLKLIRTDALVRARATRPQVHAAPVTIA